MNVREALWRTLVAERDESGALFDRTFENVLDIPWAAFDSSTYTVPMFCAAFESFRMRNKDFRICGQELSTFFPPAGTVIEVSRLQTLHTLQRVASVMTRRKLMTTVKGLLGVAPKSAAQGDVICILLGCEFLVVLRPLAN